ncbi:MAG: PepSY domain-containing protein [Lysobacterales bacterium]
MKKNALIIGLIATLSTSAHGAERVDLNQLYHSNKQYGDTSLAALTRLDRAQLVATAGNVGKTNVTRYAQYYRGIPILGQRIIAEAASSTWDAPLEMVTGTLIQNLDADLPDTNPAQKRADVIAIAQSAVRNSIVTSESANLYIDIPDDGSQARLVYLVDLKTINGKGNGQISFRIDANTGKILDQWDSTESGIMGPGGALSPVAKALLAAGWNQTDMEVLFNHAQTVYWTGDEPLSKSACGATAAAAALGFDVNSVRAAFQQPGHCRSNERLSEIESSVILEEHQAADDFSTLTPNGTKATTIPDKFTNLRKLTRADALLIPAFDTGLEWWNRLEALKNTGDHTTGRIYVNNFGADAPASGGNVVGSTLDYCSRNAACVNYRQKLKGTRYRFTELVMRDARFPGSIFSNTRTSNSGANEPYEENPQQFYVENGVNASYTVSLATGLSAGLTVGLTDTMSANFTMSLERTVSSQTGTTQLVGTHIGRKRLVVRPGCKVTVFVQEVYDPVSDLYEGYPNMTGTMKALGYLPGAGEKNYTLDAATFFSPVSSNKVSRAVVAMKDNLAYQPEYVWSKLRSDAVNCNLF